MLKPLRNRYYYLNFRDGKTEQKVVTEVVQDCTAKGEQSETGKSRCPTPPTVLD